MLPRPIRPPLAAAVLGVAAALASGCGSDEPRDRPITPTEARRLRDDLSAVRQAAAARDPEAARAGLRSFRREVRQLADEKALTPAEERQLTDGARQAEARTAQELSPPPAVPPSPSPPAAGTGGGGGEQDADDEKGQGGKKGGGGRKGGKGKGDDD